MFRVVKELQDDGSPIFQGFHGSSGGISFFPQNLWCVPERFPHPTCLHLPDVFRVPLLGTRMIHRRLIVLLLIRSLPDRAEILAGYVVCGKEFQKPTIQRESSPPLDPKTRKRRLLSIPRPSPFLEAANFVGPERKALH